MRGTAKPPLPPAPPLYAQQGTGWDPSRGCPENKVRAPVAPSGCAHPEIPVHGHVQVFPYAERHPLQRPRYAKLAKYRWD